MLEGAVEEISPEVYESFNTNVFGVVNTVRAFLPGMRAQSSAPGGTRSTIATFGSLGSWIGAASCAVYAMTKWCSWALAESLSDELAPFDIVATVIQPGVFRTAVLSLGALMTAKARIAAYEDPETPAGKTRVDLAATSGKQPWDVKKGAQAIVDVLTQSGAAAGRKVPVRLLLGTDCDRIVRDKSAGTVELLDEWKGITRSTDYPKRQSRDLF